MKFFLNFLALVVILSLFGCKSSEESKPNPQPVPEAKVEVAEEVEASALSAKAKFIVGDVERQRKESPWKDLHVGHKVKEGDKVRTGLESDAVFSMPDGSRLKVMEKSKVSFAVNTTETGKEMVLIEIEPGTVQFDVQKQKSREFKFKTGTATAAIRGTSGFVGYVNGKTVASLKEGKIEVTTSKGKVEKVVQNQTVLVDSDGASKVLPLKSSGTETLAETIDSIVKVSDGGAAMNLAVLEKSINAFDKSYAEQQRAFEKRLQFKATGIADTLYAPSVMLQARGTPGIVVTVWGEQDTVPANGIYQRTFTWADFAYGTKRFLASCSDGRVEVPCYMWVTEYANMPTAPVDTVSAEAGEKAAPAAKNLSLKVNVAGGRNERVHLDLPATELSTSLKFSLGGIAEADLEQLKSLTVLRNGKPFKSFDANDLTSLSYEVPVTIARNRIADFEVVATLKNGKNFRAKKTFEVFCMVANHPGGKARNSILPPDQEYERLKQSGELKHE